MAVFEDNTAVTLADLNNIAVDLGATSFSAFDSTKFGVDKLNEITADLVSKGILTTGDRCEPIISGGKVYIKSGVIVFGSGAKIRIESPVEVTAAAGDYIYAYNDVLTGKASIVASAEMPTTGDYVMLTQVDGNSLNDMRILATAKALSNAEFSVQSFSDTIEYTAGQTGSVRGGEIELGTTLLKRLVGFEIPLNPIGFYFPGEVNCFYDFTNTNYHEIFVPYLYYGANEERGVFFTFSLEGTTLSWSFSGTNIPNVTGTTYEYTITVHMI